MKLNFHISLYWKCQFLFWSLAALYWAYIGFTGTNFSWELALMHFVADLVMYIIFSHLYRTLSVKYRWHKLNLQQVLLRIIPAILILGLGYMACTICKNYLMRLLFQPGFTDLLIQHFRDAGLTTFVTGIRLMSIWILAYYGYHFTQREIQVVKENARLAIAAKEASFNNLSTQLNPHFFFNSLNSIKALIAENPIIARRAVDLLSDILRTSLNSQDISLIPLKQEMELIQDYLELEGLRYEKRLQTLIEIEEGLNEALILPLSIQIIVENAIKHGIAKTIQGGTIHTKIAQNNNSIQVSVQNPGQIVAIKTKGLGLNNLRERLQLQFGEKASFQIIQQDNNTVLATLIMPII